MRGMMGGLAGGFLGSMLFQANLLDYTTDEAGKVLSGSDTVPVKFEEFWTFTRPVGPGRGALRDPAGGVAVLKSRSWHTVYYV